MAAAIYTFLVVSLAPLLTRLLVALGVGFVTYTGLTTGFDALGDFVQAQFSGMPAYMLQLFGMLQLDTGIVMVLAAYGASLSAQLANGALTRVVWGRGGVSAP